MNGSNFPPARMAKRRQGFIGSSFICCRKVKDQRSSEVTNGAVKGGHWPLAKEGGKELRDRGERELIVELR